MSRWPSRGIPVVGLLLGLLASSALYADITGTVTIQGKPNSQDETFYARANGCGESPVRKTENWKIGPKGELADVIVWIADPKFRPSATPPTAPNIQLKQIGCRYIPHVFAVQAGVPFTIINGDRTLHNIHARESAGPTKPAGADVFNFGQVTQGQSDDRTFDTPGLYTIQCEVHAWMQCWVMALASPVFAVTPAEGTFTLPFSNQLQDGDYKISAWHPKFLQPLEQTLHVKNGTAVINFQFDGTKSL